MKIIKRILIAFVALAGLLLIGSWLYFEISDCGISPMSCGDYTMQKKIIHRKIPVGSGPEDMAIDVSTGSYRIIVSCSARRDTDDQFNGFYQIDPSIRKSKSYTIVPSDLEIHPHGIDIAVIDNIHWLYAITHNPSPQGIVNKILRFEIKGDTLVFDPDNVLESEYFKAPNDLHVLDDGSLYTTNYLSTISQWESTMSALGAKTGSVAYYDGKGNYKLVLEDKCYPNGIWVDEYRNHLVLVNGGCKEIQRYNMLDNGDLDLASELSTKQHGTEITMGDNLIPDPFGRVWTTSHPCPLKFLSHQKDKNNHSPSQVWVFNPQTMKSKMVYQNNGEVISAASTALFYNQQIYVSQVFDPFVVILENATL